MTINLFERTDAKWTCGIVNVPLTKPAKIYFEPDNTYELLNMIYEVFEKRNISFTRNDNVYNNTTFFISDKELSSNTIKDIFEVDRKYKPKIKSNWKYLFWELDTRDIQDYDFVLSVYEKLKLPVYVHKSMRGYHFISIKPIPDKIWECAIKELRHTNTSFPPITLRINPNKYVDEEHVFYDGSYIGNHSDTEQLMRLMKKKDFDTLSKKYIIVWYRIDKK